MTTLTPHKAETRRGRQVLYTAGVNALLEPAEALWILRGIVTGIGSTDFLHASAYDERLCYRTHWTHKATSDDTASLIGAADENEDWFYELSIPFNSFPGQTIRLWAAFEGEDQILVYLPGEC